MEQTFMYYFARGLLVGLSAVCGLVAWLHWNCIDEIVLGFKSVEEDLQSLFGLHVT